MSAAIRINGMSLSEYIYPFWLPKSRKWPYPVKAVAPPLDRYPQDTRGRN